MSVGLTDDQVMTWQRLSSITIRTSNTSTHPAMNPALTVKSQVTVPKKIREFLGIGPGERIRFEPLPDGRVAIAPVEARQRKVADPLEAMRGTAKRKLSTDDIMRLTRGEDWNQA